MKKFGSKNKIANYKIFYFENSSGFGGSANALSLIVRGLNRKFFFPIIGFTDFGPQINKINNAELINLGVIKNQTLLSIHLYKLLKKNKISLVHINTNITSGACGIIASKLAGIPCICHIRETRPLIKREIILAKLIDKIIAINKVAYEKYSQSVKKDKIVLIYDGLDIDEFSAQDNRLFRKEYALNSIPLIGLIGRIVEGKGQKEFILAAKNVLSKNPNVRFLLIGDAKGGKTNYYNEVKNLVTREGLTNKIIFTGWRIDIKEIISDLNIVVQATTTFPEGFGLTIIEAMALKKPVIATDIPGPSDIVVNDSTGYLIPPGDINAMAEKILYLLNNPDIAKKMGEEGRKRVEELFDIKKRVKDIEDVYRELLIK